MRLISSSGEGITLFRCVPVRPKKWHGDGLRSYGYRKKSRGPFQNRSRNWAVRKSEPETGTARYLTVPFSWEQKIRSSRSTFRTCLVSTGDIKLVSMITSDPPNVEVEMRSNCTSLILLIVSFLVKQAFDLHHLFACCFYGLFFTKFLKFLKFIINFKFLSVSVKFLCWCLVIFKDKFLILSPPTPI